MTKTRLETNFVRLMDQCKSMANNGKHTEWRFEKYVTTLEENLAELRQAPVMPDKEALDEYTRAVTFLKGLNITEKLPSATDKVVASQFLTPCSSPYTDTISKEIHHKLTTQYTNQVREELLTTKPTKLPAEEQPEESKDYNDPSSVLRLRKTQLQLGTVNVSVSPPKDFEVTMKEEQKVQEDITNDMLLMTQSLKEQSRATNAIIRKDLESLSKSNTLAEDNRNNLSLQTLKLQERSGFCGRCWIWLLVVLICFFFIGMVVFMRLFRKRNPA